MPKCLSLNVSVIAALVLAGSASAQTCPAVQIRNPDGNYILPGVNGEIPYAEGLSLDAYVQPGGGRRASVIVIHGGGWSSGSRVAHVGQILEVLTRAGYHWFSIDYRLGGLARYEDSLADLRAALGFVRCRASEFGIDAEQMFLLGEDTGAHLAALLAAERPAGIVGTLLFGGFYDLATLPAAQDLSRERLDRASPISRIVAELPPMLVIHGGADSEVPIGQARQYCDAVNRAKGRCRFIEAAGASHRIENWWPSQWDYKRETVEWLSALAPAPPPVQRAQKGPLQKNILYSRERKLALDAFVPPADAPVPAVVIVHGGGWEAGDKVTYVTPLFEPLARAGIAWFSIDYRLTPAVEHADQLDDVRAALRFVRAEHVRFNIDPKRVFLLGESASGQMVMQIAAEDRSIAGVISFYGVYDFTAMVTDASPRSLLVRLFRRTTLDDEARAVLRRYSPLYSAHENMPPVLLINGTGERLWAQAQAFAKRLVQLGVRHEVIRLDDAPHGLENWEGHPEWTGYKSRMVEWIMRSGR